ncbi:hypothetical protein JTB14_020066 [Gonioctena quinquepunctata]|nr:hypothetical protein JTB14_020066 [Gonioctena quinquepunctata]
MRWSLALSEYTFTIQYRPVKKHANVDTLSRVKPIRYLGTEPTLESIWNRERIRRSQQDDPAVRNIIGNIVNNSRDYYLDLDGVVYRKSEDSRHGDLLMAPSALLPEIMKTYHDLPISGHTGYDKTYARIKKMFIWPGMSKDIKKYVDACISCAQRKTSPHAKPAPLKRFDIPSKLFYRIGMDVVGPLPVTAQRNKYILTMRDALTKSSPWAIQHESQGTRIRHRRSGALIPTGYTSGLNQQIGQEMDRTISHNASTHLEEIHGRKEQLVHVNRLKRCLATEDPRDQFGNVATGFRTHNREPPRRAEVQTVSGDRKRKRYWIMELNLESGGGDGSHPPSRIRKEEAYQEELNNPDDPKQIRRRKSISPTPSANREGVRYRKSL